MNSLIQKAIEKRGNLFNLEGTNCFRLLNMDGDGIPLITADLYGEYILIQYFKEELRDKSAGIADTFLHVLEQYGTVISGILCKNRTKVDANIDYNVKRKSELLYGTYPPDDFTVKQNGVYGAVDLIYGQNTGLFLDMREIRDNLAHIYKDGDTMLNLFCYTAMFSIHGMNNGVKHAVNVDLSKAVLEKARVNYRINGFNIDDRDFIYGDASRWIKSFIKKDENFSFAVFDPPTFSRNRKSSFSVKRDYSNLLSNIELLVPGGYILSSINSHSVSFDEYKSYHPSGWSLEFFGNESSDFPWNDKPYLKVGLWRTG